MMRNLQLLEKHRKKLSHMIALVIFLFMIIGVLLFEIILSQFTMRAENESLKAKIEGIKNALMNEEVFTTIQDYSLDRVFNIILEDSYVLNKEWEIFNNMKSEFSFLEFSYNKNQIIRKNNYKYFYTDFESKNGSYQILTRVSAKNFKKEYIFIISSLLFISPFLYWILFFIANTLMMRIYTPIKDMIINLEGFASNINHEFKTSLAEILSSLELAWLTHEYEKSHEQAIRSAKRLNNILDSLWLFIHFVNSDYRKQRVDVIKILDKDILEFQTKIEKKNIKIIKKYDNNKPIIKLLDKDPLLLCFRNILKNAIRYSHCDGIIEITIVKDRFTIKDYWIGIEKENIEKIFQRYFRENFSWNWFWIGLSLVKKISDIYKWEIQIQSEKNVFTEVTIYFDQWKKEDRV